MVRETMLLSKAGLGVSLDYSEILAADSRSCDFVFD